MSTFITTADYMISDRVLSTLAPGAGELDGIEDMAEGMVCDRLKEKFNMAAELSKTGNRRNMTLVRWITSIAAYFLYSKIPDIEIPDRIIKDYDDAMTEINAVAQGRAGASLERVVDPAGDIKTRVSMGFAPRRTHNPMD